MRVDKAQRDLNRPRVNASAMVLGRNTAHLNILIFFPTIHTVEAVASFVLNFVVYMNWFSAHRDLLGERALRFLRHTCDIVAQSVEMQSNLAKKDHHERKTR